jgi:cytochrome bd-type quinol oxidase subunit 2
VPDRPPSPRIALGALALGVAFVGANLAFTQDRPAFAASPWHNDPFHAVVLAAIFTTTILVAAIAVRMLAWTAPGGGRDRERQLNRAAGVLTAVTAIAAAFQWTSVAAHDHGRTWNGSNGGRSPAMRPGPPARSS